MLRWLPLAALLLVAVVTAQAQNITPGGGGTEIPGAVVIQGGFASTRYDAGNSGAAITLDWDNSRAQKVTLTGNATVTLSDPVTDAVYSLQVCQDATGGRTLTFSPAPTWLGGAPTLSAASKCDFIALLWTGSVYYASIVTEDVTGVLAGVNGGTGQSTTTQGDLLFGAASNAWSKLAKNASATRYLSNTGTNNDPAWAQVDLTNGVTGLLPTANMAAVSLRRVCTIVVGFDNGAVLANADLGPQNDICFFPFAATVQEIVVKADGGTPNVIVRKTSVANSHTNILSAALATAASGARACSKTTAVTGIDATTTCTNTLTANTIAIGETIGLTSGTAGGVAKRMSIYVFYTVD